jgi:hypothetical protein
MSTPTTGCRVCGRPCWARGLCRPHYDKSRRATWVLVTWTGRAMNMAAPQYFRTREQAIRAAPVDQPTTVVNITTKPARTLPEVSEISRRTSRPIRDYPKPESRSKTHAEGGLWAWPCRHPGRPAQRWRDKTAIPVWLVGHPRHRAPTANPRLNGEHHERTTRRR